MEACKRNIGSNVDYKIKWVKLFECFNKYIV